MKMLEMPVVAREGNDLHGPKLHINWQKTCQCKNNHINCMTAKQWLKSQIGVWKFNYEARDIRDKSVHPATFPISLSKKVIELFTHVKGRHSPSFSKLKPPFYLHSYL